MSKACNQAETNISVQKGIERCGIGCDPSFSQSVHYPAGIMPALYAVAAEQASAARAVAVINLGA